MTAWAGSILVAKIVPLIVGAIRRGIARPVGCEDYEELAQDCMASAAAMVDSLETRARPILPRSVVYYALQRAKTGRRSTYAGTMDVLSAAARRNGVEVLSMDEPLDPDNEELVLHDVLASSGESPDIEAGRRVDWSEAMRQMNDRQACVVRETAEGTPGTEIALHLGVSAPRVTQLRREAAALVQQRWGDEGLADAGREPGWRAHVRAAEETRSTRQARRQKARRTGGAKLKSRGIPRDGEEGEALKMAA